MNTNLKKQLIENIYNYYNQMDIFVNLNHPDLELGTYERQDNKDVEHIKINNKTVTNIEFDDNHISCVMSFNRKLCNVKIPYDAILYVLDDDNNPELALSMKCNIIEVKQKTKPFTIIKN